MTDLSTLGARTGGVWTRQTALRVLSRGQVDAALAEGRWQAPWRGVHADAGVALDVRQRAFAAVLASGGVQRAVAAGRTAARLHGLPLIDDDDPATGAGQHRVEHVVAPHLWRDLRRRTPEGDFRVLHRLRLDLAPGGVVQLTDGLRCTSPARTLLDLASILPAEALVCALDDALHRQVVTADVLAAVLAEHRGERGAAVLARAVAQADGRAESPGETLARLLLLTHLPGLVPQRRVRDRHGRVVARLDLGDERLRLAVEVDGKRGHAGEVMVAKDRRRDMTTAALGWTTERLTWWDLRREQGASLARVQATAARLERRLSA